MTADVRIIRSKGHSYDYVPPGTSEWILRSLPAIESPGLGLTYLFGLWRHEFGDELVRQEGFQLFRVNTKVERSAPQKTSVEDLKQRPEIVFLDTVNSALADYLDDGTGRFGSNIAKALTDNPEVLLRELMARPEFVRCVGIVWNANVKKEYDGTAIGGAPLRVITMFESSRIVAIDCLSAPGAFTVICPEFSR